MNDSVPSNPPCTSSEDPQVKDFFISYNKTDIGWAEWIAWQLEAEGYKTVIQSWDFGPGSNFVLKMQEATSKSKRTIAVISPDYLGACFTPPEWAAAFGQDPTSAKGTLLPVRVKECVLEGLLKSVIYVDLVGLDEGGASEALLAGVRQERKKPDAPPLFPGNPPREVSKKPRFPDQERIIEEIEKSVPPENGRGSFDRLKDRLKNNPVIAPIVILVLVVIGLGAFTDSLDKMISFGKKHFWESSKSSDLEVKKQEPVRKTEESAKSTSRPNLNQPALDLVLESYKNRHYLYLHNRGPGVAFDVRVLPYSSGLMQKSFNILGVGQKEWLETLFLDLYDPSKIPIAINFKDSESILYQWEYVIERLTVKNVLRQHYEKFPDGKSNYKKPVVDFKAGSK